MSITLGNLLAVVAAVVAALGTSFTIWSVIRAARRDAAKDAREMEDRIKKDAADRATFSASAQRDRDERAANERATLLAEVSKHNETVEKRQAATEKDVTEIKVKLEGFVPKGEIDRSFEHLRGNLKQMDQAAVEGIRRHDEAIGAIRVDVGRLGERITGMSDDLSEIKAIVKETARETTAKLDKMSDAISHVGQAR